jgi:hypothetical protein
MSLLFTVEERFGSVAGVIVVGYAPDPETRLPKRGELVEVHNPDGSMLRAEVAGVDLTLSLRACFTEKTVNRAMLIRRDETVEVMVGAEIRSIPSTIQ